MLKIEVEAQRGDYGQLFDLARVDFGIDRIKLQKPLVAAAVHIEYLHVELAGGSPQLERPAGADIEAVIGQQAGAVELGRWFGGRRKCLTTGVRQARAEPPCAHLVGSDKRQVVAAVVFGGKGTAIIEFGERPPRPTERVADPPGERTGAPLQKDLQSPSPSPCRRF